MSENVIIAGVGMVPFKKPGQSESYDVMGSKAAANALQDAGLNYMDIEHAFAGYVYGDSCSGQTALYRLGMTGIPVVNVNNNCASGTTAFHLAAQAVKFGMAECVMAVGFEQMDPGALDLVFSTKTSPLARHLDAVTELMGLSAEERALPPAVMMFGCQCELLTARYGVAETSLAEIRVKAHRHAATNPNAIFRNPVSVEDVLQGNPIYRGLRKMFACPPSCGAASVIVCSESFARQHGIRADIRLIGTGAGSDRAEFFQSDPLDVMFRGLSRDAAQKAYEDAGVGPKDIDVIELHDCFTSNEAITYTALGLCAEDEIERFILDGDNTYGGQVVIGPSGGLLAKGHPLGATGLAQITELVWHLRGSAGARQVEGARTALQHNGGLGSAGFVNILQRE
ncbi:MAG: lipid-transfer protein [Alphaproteobacteria bacterium HGW-Alphaproteobacteria-5]|nr:MAG: lipid-transfer protein [Alphaproteobacteria bacterium HGW-Alphaproteobacteria-5]